MTQSLKILALISHPANRGATRLPWQARKREHGAPAREFQPIPARQMAFGFPRSTGKRNPQNLTGRSPVLPTLLPPCGGFCADCLSPTDKSSKTAVAWNSNAEPKVQGSLPSVDGMPFAPSLDPVLLLLRHRAAKPFDFVPPRSHSPSLMEKRFAEFFAGIGLMRMGLDLAGWQTVWANNKPFTWPSHLHGNLRILDGRTLVLEYT